MFIFLLIAAAFAFYVANTIRKRIAEWIVAKWRRSSKRIAVLLLAGMRTWARASTRGTVWLRPPPSPCCSLRRSAPSC